MATIRSFIIFHRRAALFGAIVFFTASLSFGLGYIVDGEINGRPIIIEECSAAAAGATAAVNGRTVAAPGSAGK